MINYFDFQPYNDILSLFALAISIIILPRVFKTVQQYYRVRQTIAKKEYLLNKLLGLAIITAQCTMPYGKKSFKSVAQIASRKLMEQNPNAHATIVWILVDNKTIHYVAKCTRNLKNVPYIFQNAVGTDTQLRGRMSGLDARNFLRKIDECEVASGIQIERKIALRKRAVLQELESPPELPELIDFGPPKSANAPLFTRGLFCVL